MTISENQEFEQELQELELKLIEANKYVVSVEKRISFRGKGQAGKWTSELNKAKKQRDLIVNDIKRKEINATIEETDAYIKECDEKERIRKEKERVYDIFKEYKENPKISIPIKEKKEKPDFSKIGDSIIDQNFKKSENAQRIFNSAKQRSSKHSPVGAGNRASQLQNARNRLNEALFDVSHEPILTNFRELFAEKKYLDMVLKESEVRTDEIQAIIDKVEKDIALFEKYGLIKQKK